LNKAQVIVGLMQFDAQVPVETPEKPVKEEKIAGTLSDAALTQILEALTKGETLVLTRTAASKWQVTKGDVKAVASGPKMRGDAYWREVLTPEFYKWQFEDAGEGKPWNALTKEEKYAYAATHQATWEKKEDERLDQMAMVEAVQGALGLVKYKEQYARPSQRNMLKGH
jgi:ABC-type tungstate transport system permease subunit